MLNPNTAMINSPLEQFEINNLIGIQAPIFAYLQFSLTNIGFYLILVLALILTINLLTTNNQRLVANKWSVYSETSLASILNIVNSNIGVNGGIFLPFIYSLFFLVLGSNLIGMVPYSFTITAQFAVCLSFSFAILIGVTILGLQQHRLRFFSLFVPAGTPLFLVPLLVIIELLSYIARVFSLGVRLAANMIAGHVLLKIFSTSIWGLAIAGPVSFLVSSIPMLLLIAFMGLELAVAFIQAYVFTLLTCSYIRDALYLHG
jgi:F-type H+-transporting ATPase subunit a